MDQKEKRKQEFKDRYLADKFFRRSAIGHIRAILSESSGYMPQYASQAITENTEGC